MNSLEALLSFLFLLMFSIGFYSSIPAHYSFSNYHFSLANDYYNVLYLKNGPYVCNEQDIENLKKLSFSKINVLCSFSDNILLDDYSDYRVATYKCIHTIPEACAVVSIDS